MTLADRSHSRDRGVLSALTLLYVASVPFDILPVAFGRTLTGPLALLLIVTWIITGLLRPATINFPASAGALLYLYFMWIVCTILWSVDVSASTTAVQTLVLQVPLVAVLSNTLGNVWLRSLVTLGISTSVLGLVVLTRPADALRGGRANVGGVDENVTAMVLAVGFAALVYTLTHLRGRRAAALTLPAVVTGAAILHTGSRSGAISAAAILAVALLPLIRQGPMHADVWLRATVLIVLSYFSYTTALDAGLVPQRVVDLLHQGVSYNDSKRRAIIDLYLQSFDHWKFFGVGLGNDASYLHMTQSVPLNAHSLLWKTWIETGIVGLTLLTAFLAVVMKLGMQSVASQALILLAVPLAIFAVTLGGDRTSVFWFVIALALTHRRAKRQQSELERPRNQAGPVSMARAGTGSRSD